MIFKCLECEILKYRKSLYEFRKVAFCFALRKQNSENSEMTLKSVE